MVVGINATAKTVELSDGSVVACDRLVVAPRVESMAACVLSRVDYVRKTPHAWSAGAQTELLRSQLAEIPLNGTFVMTIPKAPHCCWPSPYQRACLVADFLKTTEGAASIVRVGRLLSVLPRPDQCACR